jgi:hypothetical protein
MEEGRLIELEQPHLPRIRYSWRQVGRRRLESDPSETSVSYNYVEKFWL